MKPIAKPRSNAWFNKNELIRICNEKLVCAARDLAEFTKNGITASYIVALAHKCEHYEDALNQPQGDKHLLQACQTEEEISHAVEQICAMGRQIWSHDPAKYSDYVISLKQQVA